MSSIENLRAKLAQIGGDMAAITAAAEAENRALTPDEDARFKAHDEQFRQIEASIASLERTEEIQAKLAQPQPRLTAPADIQPAAGTMSSTPIPRAGATTISGGDKVAAGYAHHGFKKGIGEFMLAVYRAKTSGRVDDRLMVNAITTYGGESVGADGGYALPPQYAQGIMDAVMAEDSFLRAMNPVQTNSNLLVVPVNENPPWAATGITSAKTAEGAAITASKPAIRQVQVVMHAVKALVHVSEESLSDIPFLASWVQNQMAEHIRYQMEDYVINGDGQNAPLGILNAPGLVSIADSASTATVIGAADVFAMKAATLPGPGAFWIVNPTVLPAIWSLKTDATAGYPLFTPDMTRAPEGMLLGLPMYRSEAAKILNTTGDILLVVPGGYVFATKANGIQTATTISFAFDQELQSFRASVRMGGVPLLSAKVSRAASASSYASHLIALTGSRS